jgi:peptidoglycan/LPS O-acetylase OafA/YrhL
MTRARATTANRRRRRERWGAAAVVAVATLAGLFAAHFGTPRAWEKTPAVAPSPTSVSSVAPERTP